LYSNSWILENENLVNDNFSSQRVSDLFNEINEKSRNLFYKSWIKTVREDEFLALDITSVSTYSQIIDESEYIYNRDHENLPQVNLCLLFGEKSYLPMFQTVYNGSIADVRTLSTTILEFYGIIGDYSFTLVMDKGFYSKENIDFILSKLDITFLISVPFSNKYALNLIESVENQINRMENYINVGIDKDQVNCIHKLVLWSDKEIIITNENDKINENDSNST
jgi:transposase